MAELKHDPVPFYQGQPTPNKSNHYTGAVPICRVCRQYLSPFELAKGCPGKVDQRRL